MQEIREQKEQFEAIYQASKDGIAVLDVHTTAFLDANPAYLEMTGFTRAELLRTSCFALTLEEDLESTRQSLADQKAIEDTDSMPFEIYRQEYVSPRRLGQGLPPPR